MSQRASLPIPGHDELPDCNVRVPAHLRPDASRLIRYLLELPHRRAKFLLLIEASGHTELLGWITWMRSRRNNEAVTFVRHGGHLDKASRSIYSQGSRKGRFGSGQ
nr:hypothetical protein [Pseudomonas fluorescens]